MSDVDTNNNGMYDSEVPTGYKYTVDEAHKLRCRLLEEKLIPALKRTYFDKHPQLKSALLCVAQYYSDEAYDAVHESFVLSELEEPDFDGAVDYYYDDDEEDEAIKSGPPSDPNLPTLGSIHPTERSDRFSVARLYDMDWPSPEERWGTWDDNSEAITLWAAFCDEGNQEGSFKDNYNPAVLIRRDGTYSFKEKVRSHSDGAFSAWELENGSDG